MDDQPADLFGKPKRQVPWRGRPRVSDPKSRPVMIRCTPSDHAALEAKAGAAGLKIGPYLRQLGLGTAGPRAARRPPIERVEVARLLGQVGKIGSNVNQLARVANASGEVLALAELMTMRADLHEIRDALMVALGRAPNAEIELPE